MAENCRTESKDKNRYRLLQVTKKIHLDYFQSVELRQFLNYFNLNHFDNFRLNFKINLFSKQMTQTNIDDDGYSNENIFRFTKYQLRSRQSFQSRPQIGLQLVMKNVCFNQTACKSLLKRSVKFSRLRYEIKYRLSSFYRLVTICRASHKHFSLLTFQSWRAIDRSQEIRDNRENPRKKLCFDLSRFYITDSHVA